MDDLAATLASNQSPWGGSVERATKRCSHTAGRFQGEREAASLRRVRIPATVVQVRWMLIVGIPAHQRANEARLAGGRVEGQHQTQQQLL